MQSYSVAKKALKIFCAGIREFLSLLLPDSYDLRCIVKLIAGTGWAWVDQAQLFPYSGLAFGCAEKKRGPKKLVFSDFN